MPKLEYHELDNMPTLYAGQTSDLKIDTGTMRIWVSRCSIPDGENRPIQVERLVDEQWKDVTTPDRYYDNPHVSAMKDFYIDGGRWQGYKVTAITRNKRRE